jgi:hypothetical protein
VFVVPKPVPVVDGCWVPKLNPGLFWLLPKREVPVLVFDPKPPVLVLPNPVELVEPKRPVPELVCVWAPKRPPPVVAGLLPKRLLVFVDPNPEVVFWLVWPKGVLEDVLPKSPVPVLFGPNALVVLLLPKPPKPEVVPNAPA